MKKTIYSFALSIILISCNKQIPADTPNTVGMGENAAKVLEQVKKKMTQITSIHATIESTSQSDMYGFAKDYEGTIIAEFSGKPGTLGNRIFECKQTSKGITNHLKGVITEKGIKELFMLEKKVVKGDQKAYPKAMINSAIFRPYGYDKFFDELEGKLSIGTRSERLTNTYLEGIKTFANKKCYVIATYSAKWPDRVSRFLFGVDDYLYYGNIVSWENEDGKFALTETIKALEINQKLPKFDIDVPEDFSVEIYVDRINMKSLEVGMQAEDWTLPNQEGEEQTLSDEYAKNVILLDFWATWCGPCKGKMPFVQKMYDTYKDKGFKVISVLCKDEGHEKQAIKYLKKYNYTFDLVFSNTQLAKTYKIRFLPTVILIDKNGTIVHFRDTPGVNDNIDEKIELENAIKKALNIS